MFSLTPKSRLLGSILFLGLLMIGLGACESVGSGIVDVEPSLEQPTFVWIFKDP